MHNKGKNLPEKLVFKLKEIPQKFAINLPVTVFAIFIFWSSKFLFGTDVAAVSVLFLFTVKDLQKTTFNAGNYIKNAVFLLAAVILGTFATMSFLLAVPISLLFFFFIFYFLSDDFSQHRYYIYGLEFLLVQLTSGSMEILAERLTAFCYCTVLSAVFLIILCKFKKEKKFNKYVDKGCKLIADRLSLLTGGKGGRDDDIYHIATDFCKSEYDKIAIQGYLMTEKEKNDLVLILNLEQLNELIYDTATKLHNINEADIAYFTNLQRIFAFSKNQKYLGMEIDDFTDKNKLTHPGLNALWKKHLKSLSVSLRSNAKPKIKKYEKKAVAFRLKVAKERFTLKSYSFRYSLQSAIILTISVACAYAPHIPYGYWIPMTALVVMTFYPKNSFTSLIPRLAATLSGAAVYALTVDIIPLDYKLIFAVIISFITISVSKNKFILMLFASEVIEFSVFPTVSTDASIMLRSLFAVIGCAFACLLIKCIVNTKYHEKYKYQTADILAYNVAALNSLKIMQLKETKSNYIYELMVFQHLLVNKMNLSEDDKIMANKQRFSKLISYNCDFLSDLIYAITVIKPVEISKNWLILCEERINKIKEL